MRKICALLVLTMVSFAWVAGQTVDELIKSGQSFVDKNDALALTKFEKALEMEPNNYEALHEASLLYSRIGNRFNTKEEKTTYFRKAKDLAQKAIDANSADAQGYYVMGVALGRISLIAKTKEKVGNVRGIKKNAEEALKIDNRHPGAWHLLGRVHIGVANASKAERLAANTFFGGLPKDCSNERGIECYRYALKYRPNYILFMYDLAEAYYFDEQFDTCEETLNNILSAKNETEDDAGLKDAAKEMLEQF